MLSAANRRRARRVIWLAAAGLVLFLLISLNSSLKADFASIAEERVRELSQRALAEAVAELSEAGEDRGLLSITKTGEESFIITADTASLNDIASRAVMSAQEKISSMGRQGADIELGTVSGAALLSGTGPKLKVRFEPMGNVGFRVVSRLSSAGINQSLFSVDLVFEASVRMIIAGAERTAQIKTTVPVCETVVVGRVPQVYTNVANEEDMLNLIPTDLP